MYGAIIGAAMNVAGSIYGGIKASQAAREERERVEAARRANADWYNRQYNSDGTQRGDARRILTQTRQLMMERNRQAAGRRAVMGGTEESVAATQASNAEAMGEAASRIAAAGDARKDNIEAQYMQRDMEYNNQLNAISRQKAAAITQQVGNVASAAGGVATAWDGGGVASGVKVNN